MKTFTVGTDERQLWTHLPHEREREKERVHSSESYALQGYSTGPTLPPAGAEGAPVGIQIYIYLAHRYAQVVAFPSINVDLASLQAALKCLFMNSEACTRGMSSNVSIYDN